MAVVRAKEDHDLGPARVQPAQPHRQRGGLSARVDPCDALVSSQLAELPRGLANNLMLAAEHEPILREHLAHGVAHERWIVTKQDGPEAAADVDHVVVVEIGEMRASARLCDDGVDGVLVRRREARDVAVVAQVNAGLGHVPTRGSMPTHVLVQKRRH